MAHLRLDQAVRHHGVEQLPAYRDALPLEHAQVELEVVPDLLDAVRFQHRPELRQHPLRLSGVLRHGNVVAGVRRERERQPHQPRLFGVEAGGFSVEAKAVLSSCNVSMSAARSPGEATRLILVRHVGDGLQIRRPRRRRNRL